MIGLLVIAGICLVYFLFFWLIGHFFPDSLNGLR